MGIAMPPAICGIALSLSDVLQELDMRRSETRTFFFIFEEVCAVPKCEQRRYDVRTGRSDLVSAVAPHIISV